MMISNSEDEEVTQVENGVVEADAIRIVPNQSNLPKKRQE